MFVVSISTYMTYLSFIAHTSKLLSALVKLLLNEATIKPGGKEQLQQ